MSRSQTTMVAPRQKYAEWPAGHIAWRMGAGEDCLRDWFQWLDGLAVESRRDYILGLHPIPGGWMRCAAEAYALPEDCDDAIDEAFGRLNDETIKVSSEA